MKKEELLQVGDRVEVIGTALFGMVSHKGISDERKDYLWIEMNNERDSDWYKPSELVKLSPEVSKKEVKLIDAQWLIGEITLKRSDYIKRGGGTAYSRALTEVIDLIKSRMGGGK